MSRIVASDFSDPEVTVGLLRKSLHGGFLSEDELTGDEEALCQSVRWMNTAVRFNCDCSDWHTSPPQSDTYRCPKLMRDVEPDELRDGYSRTSNISLELDAELDYQLDISESTRMFDIAEYAGKAMIFLPDVDSLQFPDTVGRVVWLPLERVPILFDEQSREELISDINNKRKTVINWARLDSQGGDFEEITYRLVSRDDQFDDPSWGGRGPDQGKDALCSVDLGGKAARTLVQAKYNPGSSLSRKDIRGIVQDAEGNGCEGLLLTTIHVSGNAESFYESSGYRTASVPLVRIWAGPEMKEELSAHPDLISEYFIEETST